MTVYKLVVALAGQLLVKANTAEEAEAAALLAIQRGFVQVFGKPLLNASGSVSAIGEVSELAPVPPGDAAEARETTPGHHVLKPHNLTLGSRLPEVGAKPGGDEAA